MPQNTQFGMPNGIEYDGTQLIIGWTSREAADASAALGLMSTRPWACAGQEPSSPKRSD